MDPRTYWGESSLKERSDANLEKVTSSVSSPIHADSPSSDSSQATFSSVNSEAEVRETMAFMCKFLRENNQDLSEKLKFLDCVDLISTNFDCNEKEGFMGRQRYNPSLMRDTIKFLIPETSSADVQERIMAISRITRLICCIECHCTAKGMKAFKIGKLVGYLILCSNDPSENVCHWAADGLHHLYTLILQRKSMMKFGDSEEFEELLQEWEEEKLFWLAWFSDVSPTTVRFKKSLRADEQLDVILVAIKGMRDDNIYRTKAATQMLKAMLRDPQPIFIKIPKIIKSLYSDLEHISDARARQEVFRFLWMLGKSHPQEVVKTLLGCSIQCDCTASAMWNALTCFSEPAQKVLNVLQSILLEQPLYSDGPGVKATLNPLAATTALYEILRRPSPACREALRAMYPMLSIALLCQISYTVHFTPEEIDIYWSACIRQEIPTPPAPLRSALRAFKGLIRRAGDGDQALIMNRRGGSELLVHRGTHQKGLTVFARALIRNLGSEKMLPYLMDILDSEEVAIHITAMTFLAELLREKTFSGPAEDTVTEQLCRQLKASRVELRSLALDGMFYLSAHPEKLKKLKPAFPHVLARVREANREVNVKALKLLPPLLKSLVSKEVNPLALEVANSVIPLFDDASNKVRLAAISTFSCLFEIIRWGGKQQMKELALQSLVPLMVHLQDNSVPVTQACWATLRRTDKFLKSFIQSSIEETEAWHYCKHLVKRYREQAECTLVEQAFAYLENPRQDLRVGAVKLLEIIAQETKHQRTVSAIATVLDLVKEDSKPSDLYLVVSNMVDTLEHNQRPLENILGRCFNRIRLIWKR